jgi:hypothetical protein
MHSTSSPGLSEEVPLEIESPEDSCNDWLVLITHNDEPDRRRLRKVARATIAPMIA